MFRRYLLVSNIAILCYLPSSVDIARAESCFWSDDRYQCEYRKWERRREYQRYIANQEYLRRERHREHRREERREEGRCKSPLHAVGDADILKVAAKLSAIHAWQAQTVNLFGERYMDYEAAEIIDEHYDIAGLGGDVITNKKRYVITARPCLRHRNSDLGSDGEGK